MIPTWTPDEMLHAGPEHLDPAYVETYDAKAQTDPEDDVALLRNLGLTTQSTVVDLGAGSGTFALAVAPHCGRVVAVDVSPAMLALLREKANARGITNLTCVQRGFLSYEHGGAPADVVYSRNALHHLPDFWKVAALVRIAAMLRPGGLLRLRDLVFDFKPEAAASVLEGWFERAPDQPERGWTRAELETHVREEYSTYTWLLEPMLERTGFTIQDRDITAQLYAAYTCVRN